jgi:hypothetical protein
MSMSADLPHSRNLAARAAHPLHGALSCAAFTLGLAVLPAAMAHVHSNVELKAVSIDALKTAYLACDQAAVEGRLSGAAVMQCSVIYEELKQRAFGGDFEKLLAWSRSIPSVRYTAR